MVFSQLCDLSKIELHWNSLIPPDCVAAGRSRWPLHLAALAVKGYPKFRGPPSYTVKIYMLTLINVDDQAMPLFFRALVSYKVRYRRKYKFL